MTLIKTENQKGITHFTIVKILKKFSPQEINEFEKLIASPFFNNHSTVLKLFHELRNYYPEFDGKILTKEYLFSRVNKGKKYEDKLFRKYLSRLNKLAEEYLNIIQMRSETDKKDLNVLNQLSTRGINSAFDKKLNEVEKSFEKNDKIDADRLFLKHSLSSIKYNHNTTITNDVSHFNDLTDSYNNLLDYFLFVSGSILNQIDSDQYSFSEPSDSLNLIFDRFRLEEYIDELKKNNQNKHQHDRILFLELVLNDVNLNSADKCLASFENLRSMVFGNISKFSDGMLYYLLQRMNVFCVIENLKGNHEVRKNILENYKILLEKNLFSILGGNRTMTLLDFRLILSSALRTNEFDWTENFLKEKLYLVNENIRDNVRRFGFASLSFYKKNYSDALVQITKIKSEPTPITVDIYVLKSKIFYELEHYDSALSVADSFRHYITHNKIHSGYYKETLKNFLKYFKLILRLRKKYEKTKAATLFYELQNLSNTREKKWMIEKVSELL